MRKIFCAAALLSLTGAALAWDYSQNKDDMSGKISYHAAVFSNNSHDLGFPYGKDIKSFLAVRSHARYGKSVMFGITKGQVLCRSYDPCTVLVKFDDRPPIKFSGTPPDDHSTETVFLSNFGKFVQELKKSKRVLIELPIYKAGNPSWSFSVDDFDESKIGAKPANTK